MDEMAKDQRACIVHLIITLCQSGRPNIRTAATPGDIGVHADKHYYNYLTFKHETISPRSASTSRHQLQACISSCVSNAALTF
eukprot:scaffold159950_cov28-Tisochrysis_lutea.AAC.1